MPSLDPTGNPVQIGRIRLRTPGLRGEVEVHRPASPGARAAESATPQFEAAIAAHAMVVQETIEIRHTAEVPVPAASVSRTAANEPGLEVDVPDAGPEFGQVILYKDEAGVVTWNFPVPAQGAGGLVRGGDTRRYVIRRRVPTSNGAATHRGLLGSIGTKVLKVLAFKLLDPLAGMIGPIFARKWEEKKRPYLLRSFTPDNYAVAGAGADGGLDWQSLQAGKALFMIHGTISSTHGAFGSLDRTTVEALSRHYAGRMFAFDHFTLSDDPATNVAKLLEALPETVALEVDIVCHSRGGLVARTLAERQATLALGRRTIRVNRIVFVAVPNSGTTLADMDHMTDFIDSYTNLLNFVPDNAVTDTLECVITVVKQLAAGTVRKLDGLQSMMPGGPFLSELNHGPATGARYYAMSSNYEPVEPGWKSWIADRAIDRAFANKGNDLVVPSAGVAGANGAGGFPIPNVREFVPSDGIAHTRFFGQPRVRQQLLDWLTAP